MPNGGGPSIPRLILTEARELRRKQDERLRGMQALSRSILAGFLSAGLIALPAEDPISHELGLLIACGAAALVILTLIVELSASRWKEGTAIEALEYFSHEATSAEDFEMSLALTHEGHRKHNERSLIRTKRLIALQGLLTPGAGARRQATPSSSSDSITRRPGSGSAQARSHRAWSGPSTTHHSHIPSTRRCSAPTRRAAGFSSNERTRARTALNAASWPGFKRSASNASLVSSVHATSMRKVTVLPACDEPGRAWGAPFQPGSTSAPRGGFRYRG